METLLRKNLPWFLGEEEKLSYAFIRIPFFLPHSIQFCSNAFRFDWDVKDALFSLQCLVLLLLLFMASLTCKVKKIGRFFTLIMMVQNADTSKFGKGN